MREIAVVLSDDIFWTQKRERVPADVTVTIALDGTAVELDLTAEHDKLLRETLRPWLEAGREPEGTRKPGPAAGRKLDPQVRAWKKGLREWADAYKIRAREGPDRPAYLTAETRKHYYPKWLRQAYEEHLREGIPAGG